MFLEGIGKEGSAKEKQTYAATSGGSETNGCANNPGKDGTDLSVNEALMGFPSVPQGAGEKGGKELPSIHPVLPEGDGEQSKGGSKGVLVASGEGFAKAHDGGGEAARGVNRAYAVDSNRYGNQETKIDQMKRVRA